MATLVWDGNHGNGSNFIWSAWSNWSPDVVPQNGDALVFSGTRKLNNSNNLGGLSVSSLAIQSNGFNLGGSGITLGNGGLHFTGGTTSSLSFPISIPNSSTPIEVTGSRTLNVTGALSGAGGIDKTGAGVAVLGGAGTFTGETKLSGGVLQLNHSNVLQGSMLNYDAFGGALSFGSLTSATLGGLSGAQPLALTNASGTGVALSVGANNLDSTYSGALSGGGGVSKDGTGTWVLRGVNTYTGATQIHAGELIVNGALTASSVRLLGGLLSGQGSVNGLDMNGGKLSPGDDVGTFTIAGNATLDSGTIDLQLNDGVTFDRLLITTGNVVLGASLTLTAEPTFSPAPGQIFPLVNNRGAGTTTATFAGLAHGQMLLVSGQPLEVRYDYDLDGDGRLNDVVLVSPNANHSPLAGADFYTTPEDNILTVPIPGVLSNDTDADGDPLSVLPNLFQPPAHGTATITPAGELVYTPDANYVGLDTLIYQVSDGQGGLSNGTVSIDVTRVNALPVIGSNQFRIVETETMLGRLKASDVDSPALTYSLVSGPAQGRLTLTPDGNFSYDAPSVGYTSVIDFIFAVTDGQATVNGIARITVYNWNGQGIRPDTKAWLLDNNPGLQANFLTRALPGTMIKLPNGQSLPIYRLDQFLDVNFKLDFKARRQEGVNLVQTQEQHLRKLMALPEFYHWIKNHTDTYRIGGRNVSSEQAYNYLRNIHRTIYVTADPQIRAPVGGGNGINGPSWAVWRAMNIFFHEACHVIGIGHDSGGISGPLAGKLRVWDHQGRWNYSTVNINTIQLPRQ